MFFQKFGVARIHIRDVEMDQPAHLAVSGMFREEDLHAVTVDRHEDWEMRLEPVFPLDDEAEAVSVEGFASGVVCDPQSWNHALCDCRHPTPSAAELVFDRFCVPVVLRSFRAFYPRGGGGGNANSSQIAALGNRAKSADGNEPQPQSASDS